ncbi:MAG: hypothetical protein GDA49_03515 [Rhodospirillales bacterium]|nr:hypothetical protein [Rhodospirillales bacterium]
MAGQVYDNDGATLVHGDVRGNYTVTGHNRKVGVIPDINVISMGDGEFFVTARRSIRSGPPLLDLTTRNERPGVKATIGRRDYLKQVDNFALIGTAVESGLLEVPRGNVRIGTGTLTGYIKMDYFASSEDDIAHDARNYLVGGLIVNANFINRRVTTFASNFREFVDEGLTSSLTARYGEAKNGWNGRGRIHGTLQGSGTTT